MREAIRVAPIAATNPLVPAQLESLADALLDFTSPEDLQDWLSNHS